MSSRDYILQRIKQNKPSLSPLPEVPLFERPEIDLLAHFKEILQFVGGKPVELGPGEDVNSHIQGIYHDMKKIATNMPGIRSANVDLNTIKDPHDLKDLDLVVIKGEFGVAENAAVWIPASIVAHRALPFITQHMAFVLDKNQLVWNMHQAYQKIGKTDEGYGVFISGPSKTADIEQSLVIGAHGSRSLTVFLV
jgi:L-lactate dehydrogenase complex protein LldG